MGAMEIFDQTIEDLWQLHSPDKVVHYLQKLAQETQDTTDVDRWMLVHLHLVRAYTMQLDLARSEKLLKKVVDRLIPKMHRYRTLCYIEKGRILMACSDADRGLGCWERAEKIALKNNLMDLADEAARLKNLYRELVVDTKEFTYSDMKSYVKQSLLIR